jgi:NAD(P)-dependent dehydrogenase (short-subunit alcohol dehydrogenase family)
VAARNAQKSAAAVDELTRLGVESAFLPVDVEQEASCHALVGATVERFGRLDILVNNAGTAIAQGDTATRRRGRPPKVKSLAVGVDSEPAR